MSEIRVNLGPRSYDIVVTSDDPAGLGPFARARCPGTLALVVHDTNVTAHARRATDALAAAGFRTDTVALPPGEPQKDLAVAARLYDALAERQADRRTVVVAV